VILAGEAENVPAAKLVKLDDTDGDSGQLPREERWAHMSMPDFSEILSRNFQRC